MRGLVLGLGFSGPAIIQSLLPQTEDLIDRMSTAPANSVVSAIDNVYRSIGSIIADRFDGLYFTCLHDRQASYLNWVADQYNLTDPGATTPSFTAFGGLTGDGSTDYLDTAFNPTTAVTPKFAQTNAHMGAWLGTNVGSSVQWDMGNVRSSLYGRGTASATAIPNDTAQIDFTLPSQTSIGHFCWTRDNGDNVSAFKNGADLGSKDSSVENLLNLPFYLLAMCSAGPAAANFSTRQMRIAHFGAHLSDEELVAVYNAFNAFLESTA